MVQSSFKGKKQLEVALKRNIQIIHSDSKSRMFVVIMILSVQAVK